MRLCSNKQFFFIFLGSKGGPRGGDRDRNRDRDRREMSSSMGGGVGSGNTYGLSPQFLESLGIDGPLHTRLFVANLRLVIF